MALGTRCFTCRSPVDAATETRYGRVRRADDVDAPDRFVVCGACRPEVTDLTRHWTQRSPSETACSFCDADAADSTTLDLASVGLDGRVTSQGTYLLCPTCVGVFETFLRDVRTDAFPPDPPAPWQVTTDDAADVYERRASSLRVAVVWDETFEVRVRRADARATTLVETDDYAEATAHATEFLEAVEEASAGDDPASAVADVIGESLDA
ncbi:hypothetical protein [Salinirarus marinus]